jgi:hypothetical protein
MLSELQVLEQSSKLLNRTAWLQATECDGETFEASFGANAVVLFASFGKLYLRI